MKNKKEKSKIFNKMDSGLKAAPKSLTDKEKNIKQLMIQDDIETIKNKYGKSGYRHAMREYILRPLIEDENYEEILRRFSPKIYNRYVSKQYKKKI